jgi:hypothetical protein
MKVTSASSAPIAQSFSVTGANNDSSVGPGVGLRLTTVQFVVSCRSPGVSIVGVVVLDAGALLLSSAVLADVEVFDAET